MTEINILDLYLCFYVGGVSIGEEADIKRRGVRVKRGTRGGWVGGGLGAERDGGEDCKTLRSPSY